MSNQSESNAAGSLQTPTKIALIVAAGFLATAAYFFMTPTHFLGKDGGIFGCGSPMSPNNSQLGKSQCSMLETVSRDRALLFLALALLTALLGFLLFGTEGKRVPRAPRTRLEDEHDDDDDDLPRSGGRDGSRRARLGDEEDTASSRVASVARPRVDEGNEGNVEKQLDSEPRKVRTRLSGRGSSDVEERPRRRLGDEDEPRERRRGRYDDDAFDSVRD